MNRPILGITMGDPAGCGPEITVRALSDATVYQRCRPLVIGDIKCIRDALRVTNLSELKLIRMFRKHLGMTPKNYLIGLRMRKAASLLTHSAYSVGEIAQMCGYSSSHCLARAFRKHQGVSPLEYRKLYGGSVR